VRLNEKACRITRISDPDFLRASHIKPWRNSSDEDKLNGRNGLLLAPHIDLLFDKGLISFTDSADLLISAHLDRGILKAWGISSEMNVALLAVNKLTFLNITGQKSSGANKY
jgi:putative restriction endonuclease